MSLYKRLHEVQQGPGGAADGAPRRRDPVLDELRQRIHHHLIDELGPILYDKRLGEDDLRRRVHEHADWAGPSHLAHPQYDRFLPDDPGEPYVQPPWGDVPPASLRYGGPYGNTYS